MRPILVWSWLLLASFPLCLLAQAVPFEATLYYETAATIPTKALSETLEDILAYSQAHPQKTIVIQGHTDNLGTPKSNIMLSRARAIHLVQQLLEVGIAQERLVIKAFGEQYPLYSNAYEAGRKFNRRVEVFITQEEKPVYFSQLYKNEQLKKKISPSPASLVINNPNKETLWTTPKGSQIYIPAHAFEGAKGPVTVALKEAYEFSDMLLHSLSTTSKKGLLTTGGMFELKATNAQGQELQLKPTKQIGIQVPTPAVQPEMQLYDWDVTTVAGNWTNPRPLRATAVTSNNNNWGVNTYLAEGDYVSIYKDCAPLQQVFQPRETDEEQLWDELQAAQQAWKQYEIPAPKTFPTTDWKQALEENKLNQELIEEEHVSTCKNVFCRIKEAFQKKKLATAAKEAATKKRQTLQKEQSQLEAKIAEQEQWDASHKALIRRAKDRKEQLHQDYLFLKNRWENRKTTPIRIVDFEQQDCHRNYPNMPDTLHPIAEKDYQFPIFYYYKKVDSLQKYYPELEPIIAQALYKTDTYKEGIREEQYNNYLRYGNLEQLQANFPEREQEFCQTLYQVDNFQAAKKVIKERKFVGYCQYYNIVQLEQDFPKREQEACQVMYGVNTFEEAHQAKARAANLKDKFYRLQLTNSSLGRWQNIDYLRKRKDLLAQQTTFQDPLPTHREEYLIYSDTRAINRPSRKESNSSWLAQVVTYIQHTFISYYALNDKEVAFAAVAFAGEPNKEIPLEYETLTVEEFVEVLKGL